MLFLPEAKCDRLIVILRDLGLHKLVFMDDILPEGTEVGYYVRGQVSVKWFVLESVFYIIMLFV